MREIDEDMLLKRFFDDNETYPDAMNTGVAIADGLLKAGAWLSGLLRRARSLIKLRRSQSRPRRV
jgi:hypothetical protein